MIRLVFIMLLINSAVILQAQTLGGNAVFNFLKQPNATQVSALGGTNISQISTDVGMAFQNPALLRKEHHTQLNASVNLFVGGIKHYSLTTGYHIKNYKTNIGLGISYFNYGTIPQTDASGNEMGSFRPNDYVVQLMAGRQYKDCWHYGATIKFINSQYGQYKSSGIATDIGITYSDTARKMQAAIVVKNIGTQLRTYSTSNLKEELPFDLQAGISKRLAKAPLQFSLTAHNLHRFNIYYNDTAFLASEGEDAFRDKKFTLQKFVTHFIMAAQIYISNKIEVSVGYNLLRRNDLNVRNASNGLNGLTLGGGLILNDLQIRYATGFYQQNMFNQLGVNFTFN